MSSPIVPYLARLVTSAQLSKVRRAYYEHKRICKRAPHVLTVYLNISDPHSYLLLQVLTDLQRRFSVEVDFRTVLNFDPEMFPCAVWWRENAFQDARHLAAVYALDFPPHAPDSSAQMHAVLTAQLLYWELQPGYLQNALCLFTAYWQGDQAQLHRLLDPTVGASIACFQHQLRANENQQKAKGHYLSGMLYYAGEWYWGLNRLHHLEQRLKQLGLANDGRAKPRYNRTSEMFCTLMSTAKVQQAREKQRRLGLVIEPISVFWSLRSPYSYLGLLRLRRLANYYQLPLVVKPVLPMVMRRVAVPKNKSNYILMDAKREATHHGIDFGFIADPLGAGVERCYALYAYAQSQGKALDYLEVFSKAVWSQGVRSDRDSGLRVIVERAGLDWRVAKPLLHDERWRGWAQQNLLQLYERQQWGVPSICYGEVTVFGQDRIDRIEHAIVAKLKSTI